MAKRKSYLYLLVGKEVEAFKMGSSMDPVRRASKLSHPIDLSRSLQFQALDGRAGETERVLHKVFHRYQYRMPHGEGYTEWFSVDAMDEIVDFIKEKKDILAVGEPEIIQPPELPDRFMQPYSLNIPIPRDLHGRIKYRAIVDRRSITSITIELWEKYMKRKEKAEEKKTKETAA